MSKSNDVGVIRPGGNEPPAPGRSPDQIVELPAGALEHLPAGALAPGVCITDCPYDPACSIPGSWHWPDEEKDIEP